MEQEHVALLESSLKAMAVAADERSVSAIVRHLEMVASWNERVNLTAITAEREMVLKHALDSALTLQAVQLTPAMKVLDVGTGAGFPGVTLKCLVPGIELVLLESLNKRCRFLEAVGEEVIRPAFGSEGDYRVVWGRAEDAGRDAPLREGFDVVVARAVADLRVLAEYCLPFVRVGGEFVALKGPGAEEEVAIAASAVGKLGGLIEALTEVDLPEGAGRRSLVRVRKVSPTPKAYPRKAGTPSKNPL